MKAFFRINILIWSFLVACGSSAQSDHRFFLKGDKNYKDKNFEDAELNYRRALEQENSMQGTYNLGNSTYRQERFDEAVKHFTDAAEAAPDDLTKAKAFHNLGNAHFQAEQYKESVEAYKNALRLNPKDMDTKRNLMRAIRQLPPPQQNQQQQDGENQDQQQQQQEQDQQQQNQQNQHQQNQQQEQQQNQDQQQQQESQSQQQEQPQDLSKQEAEQLLEIMDQEEQKVQEKLRKAGAKKKQIKDW